ncbi:hypothetical protein HPB50_021200 [Hyalomma asiaticum]|uniref:Uncharacterized protein n=1 Tax=Hyalomma asiaticum TaxID=266040 RepID=A0ACB7RWB8_HYAAI|nr:hypothetical protein HPB50_021200 [Hyalomma asiaticum]
MEPHVWSTLEGTLDGPGERVHPASEPRRSSSSFRRIVWRRESCYARTSNPYLTAAAEYSGLQNARYNQRQLQRGA